jgi:hypothetical protein
MYSIAEVLHNADTRTVAVLLSGLVTFVGAYILYIEGIRVGFRDRTHGIPVFANMYFFAHDLYFVAHYERWFVEIGHWMYKLFWVGLALYGVLELVVHYQTLKYSRKELFPSLNGWQSVLAYLGLQAGMGVVVWFVHSMLTDPLFLIHFTITLFIASAVLLPMLRSRSDGQGQSLLLAGGVLASSSSFVFLLLPLLSSAFATPQFRALGVVMVVMVGSYMWALAKVKAGAPVSLPQARPQVAVQGAAA